MMVKLKQLTDSNHELRKAIDDLRDAKSSLQTIWIDGVVICESGSFIGNATGDVSLTEFETDEELESS